MKARIIITPDNVIRVYVNDGSFFEGKEAIEQLFLALASEGIQAIDAVQVEQHRHDHLHAHANAKQE